MLRPGIVGVDSENAHTVSLRCAFGLSLFTRIDSRARLVDRVYGVVAGWVNDEKYVA